MYSTYYEGKSFVVEIFIRTLKNKIFKHMAAVLDNFVNKYNTSQNYYNQYAHRTIKTKSIDDTFDSHAEYNQDSNVTKPKFKVGDHVRSSKYENIFAKVLKIGQKKFLLLAKLRIQLIGLMLLVT